MGNNGDLTLLGTDSAIFYKYWMNGTLALLKNSFQGMKRWLTGEDHWLLLQRTCIPFLASALQLT